MMRTLPCHFPALLASLALAGCVSAQSPIRGGDFAIAQLQDTSGHRVGAARFYLVEDTVAVALTVHGMTPGLHGTHIHAVGACNTPDFSAAGPHLDLAHRSHGFENPAGYHNGDLPNLVVGADGRGALSARLAGTAAQIRGALEDGDGSAIVIHADPDDLKTDPSGGSGKRIACGAIQQLIVLTGRH